MLDTLAFRTAKSLVTGYENEAALHARPNESVECRNCEDFLQLGIDAFDWIVRADRLVRHAMFNGIGEFDHDQAEDAICALCRGWLEPCELANKLVAFQHQRGFRVDNLDRFRECCVEMQAIVHAQNAMDDEIPNAVAELRDKAIEEHRDGQTAEFV